MAASGKETYFGELPLGYVMSDSLTNVYDLNGKYFLIYKGFKYRYDQNTILHNALNGSHFPSWDLLADGQDVYHLKKGKITKSGKFKRLSVKTNFYGNRAIATRKADKNGTYEELFLINENGKIVKSIAKEFTEVDESFEKYGLIAIYSKDASAVIDYDGNFVIGPCTDCEVGVVGNGMYSVNYFDESRNQDHDQSGVFNQFGQKITISGDFELAYGVDFNYLMRGIEATYKLDKENNVVK
ncbi:MAG: hypothetical protein EOO50_07895 [Flavobacterium sp.]|uniref:hypothetical protein n=1 Tax=Flavobacterium sp. TaxID=239 RepID=UPI0012252BDA|nr:hypothetical protein [Flavobacterium sp.]RZJ66800.1 MAG: hypothetical protein EOO50_07895 [Flavobacterium sp.]